jgi:pimeloyl-ACP methyl ester carboxylesterase
MEKKSIVLLHGAIGDKSQLSPLKKELERTYQVYSFNFDGHGTKISKKDFSIELFSQNLYDFIDENNLNKASIFGYSMGGYVALNLALIAPSKIDKIITYGTKFDWTPEIAENEIKQLNAEKIEAKIPKFATYLETVHEANNWKTVLEKTAKMMVELGEKPVLRADNLKNIQCPTLLLSGDKDVMVTSDETSSFGSFIPNSEFFEMKDFVHPILQVDARLLSLKIEEFIGN